MGSSRQEYWSELPFPSSGDLPDPGIKPGSPALQADSLPSGAPGKPQFPVLPLSKETCGIWEKWARALLPPEDPEGGYWAPRLLPCEDPSCCGGWLPAAWAAVGGGLCCAPSVHGPAWGSPVAHPQVQRWPGPSVCWTGQGTAVSEASSQVGPYESLCLRVTGLLFVFYLPTLSFIF